jgi:lipoprotein-anchoring transpeptidase ErfK/SrfK
MEIHIAEQVLLLVRHGRVQRAIHISSGAGGRTPVGRFRIYRREVMSWSVPFRVWMPFAQYFSGGYAIHEFSSVPAYPASHGCVRVPQSESLTVWRFGSTGMRLWSGR